MNIKNKNIDIIDLYSLSKLCSTVLYYKTLDLMSKYKFSHTGNALFEMSVYNNSLNNAIFDNFCISINLVYNNTAYTILNFNYNNLDDYEYKNINDSLFAHAFNIFINTIINDKKLLNEFIENINYGLSKKIETDNKSTKDKLYNYFKTKHYSFKFLKDLYHINIYYYLDNSKKVDNTLNIIKFDELFSNSSCKLKNDYNLFNKDVVSNLRTKLKKEKILKQIYYYLINFYKQLNSNLYIKFYNTTLINYNKKLNAKDLYIPILEIIDMCKLEEFINNQYSDIYKFIDSLKIYKSNTKKLNFIFNSNIMISNNIDHYQGELAFYM